MSDYNEQDHQDYLDEIDARVLEVVIGERRDMAFIREFSRQITIAMDVVEIMAKRGWHCTMKHYWQEFSAIEHKRKPEFACIVEFRYLGRDEGWEQKELISTLAFATTLPLAICKSAILTMEKTR